jgi:hypothetical protein
MRSLLVALLSLTALSLFAQEEPRQPQPDGESLLTFEPSVVSAPVVPGGGAGWICETSDGLSNHSHRGYASDADHDGWSRLTATLSFLPAGICAAVDYRNGTVMTGRPDDSIPPPTATPTIEILPDASGAFTHVVFEDPRTWALLWVRPETGVWGWSIADGGLNDPDGTRNSLIVTAAHQATRYTGATATGFEPQDVLVGVRGSADEVFVTTAAAHLASTTEPGVLRVAADVVVREDPSAKATVHVRRSGGTLGRVSVQYATEDQTAIAGLHYLPVNGTLVFESGEILKPVVIPIIDDSTYSGRPSFLLRLSEPAGTVVSDPAAATISISENDWEPILSLRDADVPEGAPGIHQALLLARLDKPAGVPVSATAVFSAESDEPPVEPVPFVIPAGETTAEIVVPFRADDRPAEDRLYHVRCRDVESARDSGSADLRIIDDDFADLTALDVQVIESLGFVEIPLILSAPGREVSLICTTLSGSATIDTDFVGVVSRLVIPAQSAGATIRIPITNDTLVESPETFSLSLFEVSGALPVRTIATVTILDDESPQISIADWRGREGDVAGFRISLSKVLDHDLTLDVRTLDGTADADDYTALSRTIVIPAGLQEAIVEVQTTDDTLNEPAQSFEVRLEPRSPVTLARSVATGTILPSDETPARRRALRH